MYTKNNTYILLVYPHQITLQAVLADISGQKPTAARQDSGPAPLFSAGSRYGTRTRKALPTAPANHRLMTSQRVLGFSARQQLAS